MELRCFVAVMLACVINVGVCYGADGQLRCSPLYFGPNAMPVPPMLHGRVSDQLCVEAGYDLYAGFYGDITHTLMLSAKVPQALYSPRKDESYSLIANDADTI